MNIAAVKLRKAYQLYYVDVDNIFIKHNSDCIVETDHGVDIGRLIKVSSCHKQGQVEVKCKLLRVATEDDQKQLAELESIEEKAYNICKEKSKNKKLSMKLISVKSLFDKTKIIFYFSAENRIDFRELVRELASVFRTRIEMRQIGVRDEARLVGGYGPCGRHFCCSSQRDEFDPVSIKMAKEQNLNLNSLKISGMCGRLLCCLGYEYCVYKDLNKNLPKVGSEIQSGDDTYTVISFDTLDESVRIRNGERILKVSKHDIKFKDNKYTIKKEVIDKILNAEEEKIKTEQFVL